MEEDAFYQPTTNTLQVCWTYLQSDQNLRDVHVVWQQQMLIYIHCPSLTSAANPSATSAAVDPWEREMDGQTDIRPFYCGKK